MASIILSNRSSNPPCPGMALPESLTCNVLLRRDSFRSPNVPTPNSLRRSAALFGPTPGRYCISLSNSLLYPPDRLSMIPFILFPLRKTARGNFPAPAKIRIIPLTAPRTGTGWMSGARCPVPESPERSKIGRKIGAIS